MMQPWKLAAALPLLAAGGAGAALVWFSRGWIVPPRVRFEPPDTEQGEEVRFRSADGIAITGWLLRGQPDAPVLILCHGYQRCMEEPFALGVELREHGFNILLFDFRGCGRSGGRFTTIGHHEPEDLLAAVRWVRNRFGPATPIGVHGISMGGAVAIAAAARTAEIRAVAADSAFAHLSGAVELRFEPLRGLNLLVHHVTMRIAERISGGRVAEVRPVDVVARIAPRPLLLIQGSRDGIVPAGHVDELYAAAGEPKDLWLLPESTHAMARLDAPDLYVDRLARFFSSALAADQRIAAAG
jgi:alpha-beta hydrolase superfamily lysophospholipase